MSTPGPVLSRSHGGDVVVWVCMHGLTHEGAIHVDRVVTKSETHYIYLIKNKLFKEKQCVIVGRGGVGGELGGGLQSCKGKIVPFDWWVLVFCESPVCVWLLQLREKTQKRYLKPEFMYPWKIITSNLQCLYISEMHSMFSLNQVCLRKENLLYHILDNWDQ